MAKHWYIVHTFSGYEQKAKAAIEVNNASINILEQKTSNIGKAIQKINKHLKEFFGREEIKLELDGDKNGYIIKRDGKIAKNLSEGEKTAIAFSYFVVKVEEKEFKIKDGIIFIDDPISSFDSNFIYHTFSLIFELHSMAILNTIHLFLILLGLLACYIQIIVYTNKNILLIASLFS